MMEPHHHLHHQQQGGSQNPQQEDQEQVIINGGGGCGKMSTSSYLCRQSSTRWTPTSEQIKLLKELYYINGVRSPTADQIQTICARLRRYGKIEGKNVFYWFQNHKARERQKKRLTPTTTAPATIPPPPPPPPPPPQYHNNNIIRNGSLSDWKQEDFILHNKYPNINNPGVSCSNSSPGVISGGGQMVGNFNYGAMTMENKFRDCSISGGGVLNGGNVNHNLQWTVGGTNYNPYAPPPSYSNFIDKISAIDEDQGQDNVCTPEIETLPLFPMHNEDHHDHHDHDHHLATAGFCTIKSQADGYYMGGYQWPNGTSTSASLELSLNSYGYGCYSSNLDCSK